MFSPVVENSWSKMKNHFHSFPVAALTFVFSGGDATDFSVEELPAASFCLVCSLSERVESFRRSWVSWLGAEQTGSEDSSGHRSGSGCKGGKRFPDLRGKPEFTRWGKTLLFSVKHESLCLFISLYVCVCVRPCICLCVFCLCVYECLCVCMRVCFLLCLCLCIYLYVYFCVRVCVHICVCLLVCLWAWVWTCVNLLVLVCICVHVCV